VLVPAATPVALNIPDDTPIGITIDAGTVTLPVSELLRDTVVAAVAALLSATVSGCTPPLL
jgi:hypothetical protein